jgi:hypothetical protein
MSLTDGEIERIAQLLFEKLVENQSKEQDNAVQQYVIYDEFGNSSSVSESEFFHYELERLYELENKYVGDEQYEKADIIKNKIRQIKLKLKGL